MGLCDTSAISRDNNEFLKIQTNEVQTLVIIQGNSLYCINELSVSEDKIIESDDIKRTLNKLVQNKEFIECLIWEESRSNPNAFNLKDTDGLPKFGILQYGKQTFSSFCVEKYGYENDIWNASIQISCANDMIRDGYSYHWGTANKCKGQ